MSENKTAQDFFSQQEQKLIVEAIQDVELKTSSEVRLHIDTETKYKALDRAAYLFKQLDMHKTEARNGVLLYMAVKNRYFAIIGDAGINYHVKDSFWEKCSSEVLEEFKKGDFCKGITNCLLKVGKELQEHFPYQEGDKNELPDELSFE